MKTKRKTKAELRQEELLEARIAQAQSNAFAAGVSSSGASYPPVPATSGLYARAIARDLERRCDPSGASSAESRALRALAFQHPAYLEFIRWLRSTP